MTSEQSSSTVLNASSEAQHRNQSLHFCLMVGFISMLMACSSTDLKNDENSAGKATAQKTSAAKSAEAEAPSWVGSMRNLNGYLNELSPYLFDSQKYNFEGNQKFIGEKIKLLAKESKNIQHSPTMEHRDPTVKFVSSKFATHLRRADNQFQEGRKQYARYELMKVTSYCIECHTRMPSGPKFELGKLDPYLKGVPALDKAELLITQRKLDAAFGTLLDVLESAKSSVAPWDLDRAAKLALQIAIQYESNPAKAQKVSSLILSNQNLPYFLRTKAKAWQQSIQTWREEPVAPMLRPRIESLVANRSSEVDVMRAIPEILKLLSLEPKGEELGELLFLAGEAYGAVEEFSPLGLNENYYESCIRDIPHSAIAKKCYKSLEMARVDGYTGSRGTFIPADVKSELEELKKLTE